MKVSNVVFTLLTVLIAILWVRLDRANNRTLILEQGIEKLKGSVTAGKSSEEQDLQLLRTFCLSVKGRPVGRDHFDCVLPKGESSSYQPPVRPTNPAPAASKVIGEAVETIGSGKHHCHSIKGEAKCDPNDPKYVLCPGPKVLHRVIPRANGTVDNVYRCKK